MTISLAFEKQCLPSFSKMWWVNGGEQRFNERDAKMTNYAVLYGKQRLEIHCST